MTRSEKKDVITRIRKIVSSTPNKRPSIKFTFVELTGVFLMISHTAGAIDGTEKHLNDRLIELGFPTVPELKDMFDITQEKGNCANHYMVEFRLKAIDRDKIKIAKAKRMGNIPNAIKI